MRIVGGEWKGRIIDAPKGRDISRPTVDRVREAIASMVNSALEEGIEGISVLDAFAGSGALGIEMLSRGAKHAVFFDNNKRAADLVRQNLKKLSCSDTRAQVVCADVLTSAQHSRIPGAPFDLVVIDPPYVLGVTPAQELLMALAKNNLLSKGAYVTFERASDTEPLAVESFVPIKSKRYGQTYIDLLKKE